LLLLGAQASPPAANAISSIELFSDVAGGDACAPSNSDRFGALAPLKGYSICNPLIAVMLAALVFVLPVFTNFL